MLHNYESFRHVFVLKRNWSLAYDVIPSKRITYLSCGISLSLSLGTGACHVHPWSRCRRARRTHEICTWRAFDRWRQWQPQQQWLNFLRRAPGEPPRQQQQHWHNCGGSSRCVRSSRTKAFLCALRFPPLQHGGVRCGDEQPPVPRPRRVGPESFRRRVSARLALSLRGKTLQTS